MRSGKRLRLWLIQSLYKSANTILRAFRRMLWPVSPTQAPQRVCIYRIGNVGDMVCALPAMRAIRRAYPLARLTLLTSPGRMNTPGAREVLEGNNWLDDLIVYHDTDIASWVGRRTLLHRLRQDHVDLWVELPTVGASLLTLLRNMVFAKLSGAKWGSGWRISTIHLWSQLQSDLLNFPSQVDRLLRIVREEGLGDEKIEYGLARNPEISNAAKETLRRAGIRNNQPFLAIAPGAKRATNRWMPERWIEVGRELAGSGHRLLLLGGPSEIEVCKRIADGIGSEAVSIAGQTSLVVLPEILRRCTIVLCVDSGVQHIAGAVGSSCVSLTAARDYQGKWHPHGVHTVIEKRVPCHTCLLEHCPNDNLCMREITVAEVVGAAMQLMRHSRIPLGQASRPGTSPELHVR